MKTSDLPLRVLQVVTNMDRGGLETMLMNYYRQIDRTKVQFDFLTHRKEKAAYDDEIASLGGKIYHLPRLVPWSLSYKKALRSFFEAHPEYSVIHVHQDCLSSVVLKAAAKQKISVRIAHSHNTNQDKNLKYPIKLFYKQFIPKYATHLMACGNEAGLWMFGDTPFSILRNAIDAAVYSFHPEKREAVRAALHITPHTIVVGHVGRFAPQKNHAFLLDVFAEFQKLHVDSHLLLVGEGSLLHDVEEQAARLGIVDKITFTGVRSDVNDLLQAMDVFVFPSHYEGFPVTMVEAQAAGLPCIISDNVPTEGILREDLVERLPLSPGAKAWAERLATDFIPLPERKNTTDDLIQAGFDIHTAASELERFYLEVLSSSHE